MIKKVRKRPTHNLASSSKKGVVYLPPEFIGSMVRVLTEFQYKTLMTQKKRLQSKIARIKDMTRHEYVSS